MNGKKFAAIFLSFQDVEANKSLKLDFDTGEELKAWLQEQLGSGTLDLNIEDGEQRAIVVFNGEEVAIVRVINGRFRPYQNWNDKVEGDWQI